MSKQAMNNGLFNIPVYNKSSSKVVDTDRIKRLFNWKGDHLPYCDICHVEFSSPVNACDHFTSSSVNSKHKKNMEIISTFTNCESDNTNGTMVSSKSSLCCHICYCQMNSTDQYKQHMLSQKHCNKFLSYKRVLEIKKLYEQVCTNKNVLETGYCKTGNSSFTIRTQADSNSTVECMQPASLLALQDQQTSHCHQLTEHPPKLSVRSEEVINPSIEFTNSLDCTYLQNMAVKNNDNDMNLPTSEQNYNECDITVNDNLISERVKNNNNIEMHTTGQSCMEENITKSNCYPNDCLSFNMNDFTSCKEHQSKSFNCEVKRRSLPDNFFDESLIDAILSFNVSNLQL